MTNTPTPSPFLINRRAAVGGLTTAAFTLAHDKLALLGDWYYLSGLGLFAVALIGCGVSWNKRWIQRIIMSAAVIGYGALLVVMVFVTRLSPAWTTIGPIVVAAAVGMCAVRDYENCGWRLPFGLGLLGCGVAITAMGVELLGNPIVWGVPGILTSTGLAAGIGGSVVVAGAAILADRSRLLAGAGIAMYVLVSALGAVCLGSFDAPVGSAVLVLGLAHVALLVPKWLGRTLATRIGLVACGLTTSTVGAALLITPETTLAWCLLGWGAVQAGGALTLLVGRRVVIEAFLVLVGSVFVGGGIAAVVADLPAYGVAVIGVGIALAVQGVARPVGVPLRRLVGSPIRFV